MKNIFIIMVLGILLLTMFSFGCPKKDDKPPIIEVPANTSGTDGGVTNTTTPPKLEPCEDKQNVLEKDSCLKDIAVARGDKGFCAKIYSTETKDECLYSFISQGVFVCDEMTSGVKKDACLDFHARSAKNLSLCDRIGDDDTKRACVNAVSPPCLAVADKKEREICMVIADKNLAGCNNDEQCLYEYGKALNSTEACDGITLRAKRTACRSLALGEVKCKEELTLEPDWSYCLELVAVEMNDVYYCERIPTRSSYSTDCFTALAIQQKNGEYCRKPAMEDDDNNCFLKYAIATGESQWCTNITYYMSSMRKDNCYRQIAIKYNNPMVCDGIPAGAERTGCYGLVLSSDLPFAPETCRGISSPEWKDTCYYRVAVQKNDGSYCDSIISPTTKLNCKDKFITYG